RPGAARTAPFTLPPAAQPGRPPADGGCRLVGRALGPRGPVEVFTERGEPIFVRGEGLGGRVVGAAGPWRVVAEWWSEDGVARDYYDLELTDGGVYRCYRELGGPPPPAEREARSGSPAEREARSGSPAEREARSGSPAEREARSGSPAEREARSGSPAEREAR